jgi:hypothetical protein
MKNAEGEKKAKEWKKADNLLNQALELNVDNQQAEWQLGAVRKEWHGDTKQQLEEELDKKPWSQGTWNKVLELLSEASAISGFGKDMSLNALTHEKVSARVDAALQEKNWIRAKDLDNMAKQVPGYKENDAITQKIYKAFCNDGDDALQDGHADNAMSLFVEAENLHVADDNRARNGIENCQKALAALEMLPDAKEDLHTECQALLTKKDIQNLDQSPDFQRCLKDCWDCLIALPKKQREQNMADIRQMIIDCLTEISDKLRYDLEVLALTEENQSEAKRVFLEVLNVCEKITGGAISDLDDGHLLWKNVNVILPEATKDMQKKCDTLQQSKNIQKFDPDIIIDFKKSLKDYWNLLDAMPEKPKAILQGKIKEMVIDDCLGNISNKLLNDSEFQTLPEENQSEAKRVFLGVLNDCDIITGGAISDLDESHLLRKNVSAFFTQKTIPPLLTNDAASTFIISWLAPLVAGNHQD